MSTVINAEDGKNPQLPSYLQNREKKYDFGDMNKFRKPPYFKIIQALAGPPFKPPFKDGDGIVVVGNNVKIADLETEFTLTPILFFPTWDCFNPPQLRNMPALRDVSYDENSELAIKARKFIKEPCPENSQYQLKYCTTLNFLGCVQDHPEINPNLPIIFRFNRGEYKTGQILIGMMQDREQPPYACRFNCKVGNHPGKLGNWFGLDIRNSPMPFHETEEIFLKYEKLHDEMQKVIAARQLVIDMGSGEDDDASAETRF